jgi:hypothetical protein
MLIIYDNSVESQTNKFKIQIQNCFFAFICDEWVRKAWKSGFSTKKSAYEFLASMFSLSPCETS